MPAPAVLLAAALPGAPLVSLVDACDVVQYLVVRLDVEIMVLVPCRAARRRCGDTRRAARRCAEHVRDAVPLNVVPFDAVMLMPLAVFSTLPLDALLGSREAGT